MDGRFLLIVCLFLGAHVFASDSPAATKHGEFVLRDGRVICGVYNVSDRQIELPGPVLVAVHVEADEIVRFTPRETPYTKVDGRWSDLSKPFVRGIVELDHDYFGGIKSASMSPYGQIEVVGNEKSGIFQPTVINRRIMLGFGINPEEAERRNAEYITTKAKMFQTWLEAQKAKGEDTSEEQRYLNEKIVILAKVTLDSDTDVKISGGDPTLPIIREIRPVPVNSSWIESVGYSPLDCVLQLNLKKDGLAYQYHGVGYRIFAEILEAESPGSYFNKNIKGQYQYRSIGAPTKHMPQEQPIFYHGTIIWLVRNTLYSATLHIDGPQGRSVTVFQEGEKLNKIYQDVACLRAGDEYFLVSVNPRTAINGERRKGYLPDIFKLGVNGDKTIFIEYATDVTRMRYKVIEN